MSALDEEGVMARERNGAFNEKIDPEWFKWVIHKQGSSIRKLGADVGISKTERTIRRAVESGSIRFELLDEIAKKLDVHPDYLAGKYAWTLTRPKIMELDGVRDYWRDNYLDPSLFPYRLYEQERVGLYKQLLDTLQIHGISEADYRKLDWDQRRELQRSLDRSTTQVLNHWFPNRAKPIKDVEYFRMMEWEEDRDVVDALEEYLAERGFITLYDISPDGQLIPVQASN